MHIQAALKWLSRIAISVLILFAGFQAYAGKVSFAPFFGVEATYNGNVFYLDKNKASDFSMSLAANFPLVFSSQSRMLSFSYSPYTEIYKDHEELNYTGHRVNSSYDASGKRYNLRISETFSYSQRQGYLLDYQEFPVTILGRTTITSNSFILNYGLKIRNISFFNFNLGHLLSQYKDLPSIDYENTATISSGFDNLFGLRGSKNQIGYFYQFRKFKFESSSDQDENAFGFAYKYEHFQNIILQVKAGVFRITGESLDSENDPFLYADISKIFKRGTIRMILSRDAGVTGGLRGLSVNDRYFLGFSYKISPRTTFGIFSEYYKRNPFEKDLQDLQAYGTFAIDSTIDFKVSRKLSLSLNHRYVNQKPEEGSDLKARFHTFSFQLEFHPFKG